MELANALRRTPRAAAVNATRKMQEQYAAYSEETGEEPARKKRKLRDSTAEKKSDPDYCNSDECGCDDCDSHRSIVSKFERLSLNSKCSCKPCPPCQLCDPWHPLFQPDEDDEEIKPELDESGEIVPPAGKTKKDPEPKIPAFIERSHLFESLSSQEIDIQIEIAETRLRLAALRWQQIQITKEEERRAREEEKVKLAEFAV